MNMCNKTKVKLTHHNTSDHETSTTYTCYRANLPSIKVLATTIF